MDPVPRVSVIVPSYNHAPFLRERLASIRNQTWTDRELILLDDASTDHSLDILKECASDPETRLIVNPTNSGSPFAQWNRGVEAARGEYVWIAESDDSARPEFLQSLVAALEQHPSAVLAQSATIRIDEQGRELGLLINDAFPDQEPWSRRFLADGREEIRRHLYLQNTIPSASAVVFRRSAWLRAGWADPSFRLSGDCWQWARLLLHGDLYYIPEPLNFSRVHQQSQRFAGGRDGRLELEALRVQQGLRELLPIDRSMIQQAARRVAVSWLQAVRSGRWNGPQTRHLRILVRLLRADWRVGLASAARLPYGLMVWGIKNLFFPDRLT